MINVVGNFPPKAILKAIWKQHIQMSNHLHAINATESKYSYPNFHIHNENTLKCSVECRFKTKHQLTNHTKRHVEFKPHECTVCAKRFRQVYGLKVHMRSHTGIYPYSCKFCGREFRHTSSLKVMFQHWTFGCSHSNASHFHHFRHMNEFIPMKNRINVVNASIEAPIGPIWTNTQCVFIVSEMSLYSNIKMIDLHIHLYFQLSTCERKRNETNQVWTHIRNLWDWANIYFKLFSKLKLINKYS